MLRVNLPMLPNCWGEDFVPINKFPESYCVMVGREPHSTILKPYTPIQLTPSHMDFLVKAYPEGRVSRPLYEAEEGDVILIQGPRSKFNVSSLSGKKRIVCLAAGTGISPIFQVLQYLKTTNKEEGLPEIHLIYANKSPSDILLISELEDLQLPDQLGSKFTIKHCIERLVQVEDLGVGPIGNDEFVLVCGPKGFNDLLLGDAGLLAKRGYSSKQVFSF